MMSAAAFLEKVIMLGHRDPRAASSQGGNRSKKAATHPAPELAESGVMGVYELGDELGGFGAFV